MLSVSIANQHKDHLLEFGETTGQITSGSWQPAAGRRWVRVRSQRAGKLIPLNSDMIWGCSPKGAAAQSTGQSRLRTSVRELERGEVTL